MRHCFLTATVRDLTDLRNGSCWSPNCRSSGVPDSDVQTLITKQWSLHRNFVILDFHLILSRFIFYYPLPNTLYENFWADSSHDLQKCPISSRVRTIRRNQYLIAPYVLECYEYFPNIAVLNRNSIWILKLSFLTYVHVCNFTYKTE